MGEREQQQSIGSEEGVPLLRPRQGIDVAPLRPNALARLLNRAAGQRGGGPSNIVRETAAVQLEERRADWGYSKPVVALDIAWNLAFTVVSIVMLSSTLSERPNTPIRVWIAGYALQCVIHVLLVSLEYRRRRRVVINGTRTRTTSSLSTLEEGLRTTTTTTTSNSSSSSSDDDSEDDEVDAHTSYSTNTENRSSIAKRCESINTMASFFWWIVGFYWIVSGGDLLLHSAPRLYWLAVVFLAFDVFFAIFCVALACMIGIALCCCLPCIIAVLYAVAGQEGASESDLGILQKYNYKVFTDGEKSTGRMVPVDGELADTHVLLPEDAECCICLSSYEDAAELHTLPCSHHFHSTCIVKWLKINASCPLCKYNILKGNGQI